MLYTDQPVTTASAVHSRFERIGITWLGLETLWTLFMSLLLLLLLLLLQFLPAFASTRVIRWGFFTKSPKALPNPILFKVLHNFLTKGKTAKKFGPLLCVSGHRVRLQNRRSRVRIPPGCKVLLEFIHCSAVVITKCALSLCVLKKNECF
jgi:hypothetical protein